MVRRLFLDRIDRIIRSNAESRYFKDYKFFRDRYWTQSSQCDWFKEVLEKYQIPETMSGGCIDGLDIFGRTISISYFVTMARIFNFHDHIDFGKLKTLFIIGGAFGYEAHLLMSLFPNIKTCITLDIPPNLYVQTQYLKAVLKERVRDYSETSKADKIAPSQSPGREVIAITPWQIEDIDMPIDLVWNSCSFQEMNPEQVRNYARFLAGMLNRSAQPNVCLTMYNSEATTSRAEIIDAFEGYSFGQIEAKRKLPVSEPYEELYFIGARKS